MTTRQYDHVFGATLLIGCALGLCACLVCLFGVGKTGAQTGISDPGAASPAPVHHMRGWEHDAAPAALEARRRVDL